MEFLMTFDVESFSIPLNRCDPSMVEKIKCEALPSVICLLSKYDVRATFYFTGEFVEIDSSAVDFVRDHGHEIGCHGYDHTPEMAFDVLSYEEQVKELKKAKSTIPAKLKSFRAPMLRINEHTLKALEHTGFRTDSSICSQRFDGPLTFGSRKKLRWLLAPRMPYHPARSSVTRKGNSKILEVPISAIILPFIGTTMRITPNLCKILRKLLYLEAEKTGKPIVFLFHPNECVEPTRVETYRRAKNVVEFFFADYLRQRLKLRNLGRKALRLLDDVLRSAKNNQFEFLSMDDYWRRYDGRFRA